MTWWDERSVGPVAAAAGARGGEASSFRSARSTPPPPSPPPPPTTTTTTTTTAAAEEEQEETGGTLDLLLPLATVDLEDPYLRDLVLQAFESRKGSWRVERADPIPVEVRRAKVEKPDDDGNSTSSSEEDEGGGGGGGDQNETTTALFDLLPSPLISASRFHWGEYERIDWDRVAKGDTIASSFAVRKGLTRKAQLALGLRKWVSKRPGSPLVGCFPETFILQVDHVDYIDEALSDLPEVRDAPEGASRWIVKPSITNRAAGVAVVDGCESLRRALERIPKMREWVVQRYIDNPLLLPQRRSRRRFGGKDRGTSSKKLLSPRKWHVRSYALCVGALKVYSFGGMLALTAVSGYEGAALDDLDAHLTNTCRKREGGGGKGMEGGGGGGKERGEGEENDDDDDDGDDDDGRILLLSEIPQLLSRDPKTTSSCLSLPEATEKTRQLASRISTLVAETFAAVSSELTFFALPSAFELFGFDFLVDENWNPWLLEANADPDVGASGSRLREVIRKMVEGVLKLTADELVVRGKQKEENSSSSFSAKGKGENEKEDDDESDNDPLAPKWRLVFERDSGREGAGFRVG